MRPLRGPIAAFTLAAVYGLTFGPLLILVGLFTGPLPLTAGVIHLAIGLASLSIIAALAAERPWARPAALALSLLIALPAASIAVLAATQSEWPVTIGAGIAAGLFAAVTVELLRRP